MILDMLEDGLKVLYCESGNILTYHGDYCMDDEKNTTTKIVEELLKKCQITI